ncbi:hypothetical protein, conserved [Eimeria tenella]|uniref:Uncharacterized protein n=1 Tax=Eimeria tenella TaxID=5802 RepID=U6KKB3_EIMTE|nr:hypothetical protein, conserved [Eimeria tenella]CDJ38460.1 hypothetical protein, conserved [Eimeria tenella]|eukprot:XP_013229298.1 hypothetical protein, conserved [Eimeria tenella]
MATAFVFLLATAAAACWCSGAAAWTPWAKPSPPGPQNFDDQSVDPVPSSTRDFEYTKARKAAPFYPESEAPVVEVEPQQERFRGLHAAEVGRRARMQGWTTG